MPSIAVKRDYEAIYILDPESSEEQVETTKNRYKQLVETFGGTVTKAEMWERRKLAYEIKGRNEGIYVIMQFNGEATVEAELRRVFMISEDQIRYMIVKSEEIADPIERAPRGSRFAEEQPTQQAAAPVAEITAAAETPEIVEAPHTEPATEAPAGSPVAETEALATA